MTAPGVATANSFEAQPPAPQRPVFVNGFDGILRTGGRVTAGVREVGRHSGLINSNESYEQRLHHKRINSKTAKFFPAILIFANNRFYGIQFTVAQCGLIAFASVGSHRRIP